MFSLTGPGTWMACWDDFIRRGVFKINFQFHSEPLNKGNLQNAEGVRSLDGLAVPDKEASISCCFGEQILSFGARYIVMVPRLVTWHPV